MTSEAPDWHAVRRSAPLVLAGLVRRYGHFDACEDAVQEALVAASAGWPVDGWPANPAAWLTTVAARRLVDQLRSDESRRRRESADFARTTALAAEATSGDDDTVTLLFLCCHPALKRPLQVALTLRAVGGLTTAEIARAFLVPEATMAQRISRAKQRVREAGAAFVMPDEPEHQERLRAVLAVLYLMFNEGYTASSGAELTRTELTDEAIRIMRIVHRTLPRDGEVTGLLALMLLTDARRRGRTAPDGSLIPLAEQDRSLWDGAAIAEGVALITGALRAAPLGPYQLQAAIAAVHDEAASREDTDWRQIVALYELLERLAPNPVVTLNRAVAVAMVDGPEAGLIVLETCAADRRVLGSHRVLSVRAHLLELAGDAATARVAYEEAARRTTSVPERRHLLDRARRLAP